MYVSSPIYNLSYSGKSGLLSSLKRHGVSDEVITEALNEVAHG